MARKGKNSNRNKGGGRNNLSRNDNNFNRNNNQNINKNNSQRRFKLEVSPVFMEILKRVSDMNDPVADYLISLTKKNTALRMSYFHITKKNNYTISLTYLDKIKSKFHPESEGWDKKNRILMDFRKLLNKLLKGSSLNRSQIGKFMTKYKSVYSDIKRDLGVKKVDKEVDKDQHTLEELLKLTETNQIQWRVVRDENEHYVVYVTSVMITNKKRLLLKLYFSRELSNYMIIYFVDEDGSMNHIRKIENDKDLEILHISVLDNIKNR